MQYQAIVNKGVLTCFILFDFFKTLKCECRSKNCSNSSCQSWSVAVLDKVTIVRSCITISAGVNMPTGRPSSDLQKYTRKHNEMAEKTWIII